MESTESIKQKRVEHVKCFAMDIQFQGDSDDLKAEVTRLEAKFGEERSSLDLDLYERVKAAGSSGLVLVPAIELAGPSGRATVTGYKCIAIAKDPLVRRYFELLNDDSRFGQEHFIFGDLG